MTVISRRIFRHGEAQTGSEQRHLPTFIAHSIDTPEKFEAKRAELAEREWARMKENNSATCRSCHNYDAMDHASSILKRRVR